MKKLLTLIALSLTVLLSSGQVLVQSGLGLSTSGFIHPISEADAGWVFPTNKSGHTYQATIGWQFNPYIDKTIYSVKGGVEVDGWTIKAGVGLVNRFYNTATFINRYPQDGYYVYDTYVSAYNTLILGAERYINKWQGDRHRVYYGADFVDGNFNVKMGVRFVYNIKAD